MRQFLRLSPLGKNLLTLCFVHLIVDFFNGIWPIYKTICGMDIAKAALIAGVSGFIGESLQIFFGFFCDKGYRKHILIFGFVISSSILLITLAEGFVFYFLLLLILKIGSAAFHPAGFGYVGSLTEKHRSKAILLFSSGGLFGLACSQIIFTKTLDIFNGHSILLLIPVLAICAALFFHPFPPAVSTNKNTSFSQIFSQFKQEKKTFTLLYLIQLSSYSLVLSLIFLLPDILAVKTTDSWLRMGGGHFCYILGGALVLPPVGFLCDRFNQKKIILGALVLSLILFYYLTMIPSLSGPQGIVLLLMLGAALNSVSPMIISWGLQIAPNSPSSVSAVLIGLAWSFSNLGTYGSGVLYKTFKVNPETKTLLCMGILLIISIALTWITPAKDLSTQPAKSIS